MKTRAHLIISGRVQGVCYRAFTKEEATNAHLTGWIRNLPSGQVEAVFEGEREIIDTLIALCQKGPPGAGVQDIKIIWEDLKQEFDDFRIVH